MLLSYITTESNGTLTLDQLLRGPLSLSAREVREAKRLGLTVDGAPFFANQRIGAGRTVAIPLAEYDMPTDFPAPAEVDILYQDDALIAVRKPAPLQVHPSPSAPRGADTLEGRVQSYLRGGAHPVHRLDAETTGIVLFAKLPYVQAHIQRQMQADTFRKEYLALVCGVLPESEGVIDAPIDRVAPDSFTRAVLPGGQRAVTRYRVEAALRDISLVRLFPVTGRTHQLRVHMAHIGHPLLGDTRYFTAESANLAAQYHAPYHQLCAVKLSLIHPITGKTLEIACTPDFSVDILFHL